MITDELRRWAYSTFAHTIFSNLEKKVDEIADRIDERHEDMRYDFQHEFDGWKFIRDTQWVELPKDADGVPIHVGDTIEIEHNGRVTQVDCITCWEESWMVCCSEGGMFDPKKTRCHHVQPDSWKSIIKDARECVSDDIPLYSVAELVERCRRLAGAE